VKSLLSLALTVIAFLTCYGDAVYLSLWPPHQGKALYLTVRSQHPLHFDQEKALGNKRKAALAEYTPLYNYMPERAELSKNRFQDLIRKVSALSSYKKGDEADFEKYLQKEFGLQVGTDGALMILQYSGLKNLLEAILAIEESMLQNRIVKDPEPLRGKKTVEVIFPTPPWPLGLSCARIGHYRRSPSSSGGEYLQDLLASGQAGPGAVDADSSRDCNPEPRIQ
jgi:membrane-associated HD superfamily phosphohydrolase